MRDRLFHASLATLLALTAAVAWAGIHSARVSSRRIARVEAMLNGERMTHAFWTGRGGSGSFEDLRSEWMGEGWVPAHEGLDLAAALLGLSQDETLLSSEIRVHAFLKEGRCRILAVLDRGGEGLAWSTELAAPSGTEAPPRLIATFPLPVPDGATGLLCLAAGRSRYIRWRQPADAPGLEALAASRGFECRPAAGMPGTCELRRGGQRLWAETERLASGSEIRLLEFAPSSKGGS